MFVENTSSLTRQQTTIWARKLNDRLEKIKRQACGNGKKSCVLCNDQPWFFSKFYTCKDCRNVSLSRHCHIRQTTFPPAYVSGHRTNWHQPPQAVCSKCSIDSYELNTGEAIWLCKICSESREVLKKTNQWTLLCNLTQPPR